MSSGTIDLKFSIFFFTAAKQNKVLLAEQLQVILRSSESVACRLKHKTCKTEHNVCAAAAEIKHG